MTPTEAPPAAAHRSETVAPRTLGRFRLLQLVGKSRLSMVWRALESASAGAGNPRTVFLLLPREQPVDRGSVERWHEGVQRGARLNHPNLANLLEAGETERWPYAVYDATGKETLPERLQAQAMAACDAAGLFSAALSGLAFAHEGGVAHRDIQPSMLLLDERGVVRLMGLEVATLDAPATLASASPGSGAHTHIDALALQAHRAAARHDVLCMGLLFHQALSGKPALDEPDIGALAARLPPRGRELVRLPWDMPLPVPEPLRAIANRSTDRQERQRYRSARGLLRALEGWLQAEGGDGAGLLPLLLDRLHSVGSLPASPGSAARSARLATMDRHRTFELAQVVLQDLGLAFELLRAVNSAQVRGAQVSGSGPVLTVRRAIAMLGIDGVRRAATALRDWPGPLSEPAAQAMREMMDQAKRAARVAQALRPAGYDAEAVSMICLLQNLGRLIAAYHFPDEWQQIRRLMESAAPQQASEPREPGMSEQVASFAVLGADIEAIGTSVARHWGLDDSVLHLIRRLPLATAPRSIGNDADMLRAVASCANEAVDAANLDPAQRDAALRRVAQRYARPLRIDLRDLQDALNLQASAATGPEPNSAATADAESEDQVELGEG